MNSALLRRLALAAVTAMLSCHVGAQPTKTNGCGSAWNSYLVPDWVPVLGCAFKTSCDHHDVCYGRCESQHAVMPDDTVCAYRLCRAGGLYFGQPRCDAEPLVQSELAAQHRKQSCDRQFYLDMHQDNLGRPVCEAIAAFYEMAVTRFGNGAFRGVAPVGGKPGDLPLTPESRQALEQFFRAATPDDARKLIEQLQRSQRGLDPTLPLIYEPGRGLRNDVTR